MGHNFAAAALVMIVAAGGAQAAPKPKPGGPVPTAATGLTDPKSLVSAANPDARPVPVADLFSARGLLDAAWSADGRQVVLSTNLTGRYNLWRVDAAGGWPVQLTRSEDRHAGLTLSPDGKWVVYEADTGGNEMYDLYAVPLAGGEPVNLTNSPDVSETHAQFSSDGARIAFEAKPKARPGADIAVMDVATRKVTQLTHEAAPDMRWSLAGWMGAQAVVANRGDFLETLSGVWKVTLDGVAPVALTDPKLKANVRAASVSLDGRLVGLTSNEGSGQDHAGALDIATRSVRWAPATPWEQSAGSFTPDGRSLVIHTNADGRGDLSLLDAATGAARPLGLPPGVNAEASSNGAAMSRDGRLLAIHQASNTPVDLWVADIAGGGGAKPLTHLALASIDGARLPQSQIVHYASEDGTLVSAILIMPFNLKRDGTNPAIVGPHGGPTGQTLDNFGRQAIALSSRGYIVILPNVRGSTGYGKAFQAANIKDLGGKDLVDEVYAAKFLVASGYADPRKMGITGGSYGGFMTLMAIGRTPDIWKAAVSQYGIINWYEMLKHEDAALQAYQRGLIGDPVADKAVYDAASPMTYIKQAKAPLLVLQGENDIRVPKGQAEEVVATLKGVGSTVDAVYYPAEGHGFAKRENQIDALQRTVDWFDRYLKTAR